jgi:UDP-3-O-[3-hydroxymyristoyl] N-acetylglucosamine deacetylase
MDQRLLSGYQCLTYYSRLRDGGNMTHTIKKSISIDGVGLHSGRPSSIKLIPKEKAGISFLHLPSQTTIPLSLKNVNPVFLGTTLQKGDVVIKTIEHILAALWYFSISGLTIEMSGDEVPICDGSAKPFVLAIKDIGLKRLNTHPKVIKISEPVSLFDGDCHLIGLPDKSFSVNFTIDFPQTVLKAQNYLFKHNKEFEPELMACRTFGNVEDVEMLHSQKLALGATLENALVYNSEEYLTPPLYQNEAVRHKILDLLGDFYVSGYHIQGKILAYKSSHKLNNKFMKKLIKECGPNRETLIA